MDSDGVFHQRVDRVDLGSLNWTDNGDHKIWYTPPVSNSKVDSTNGYCKGFEIVEYIALGVQSIVIHHPSGNSYIKFRNEISDIKQALQGVYLYYELAEEKTINVDGNEAVTQIKNDLDRIEGISTTEQIVGTFLGKNLYRNTVVLNFSTPFTVASGNNDTCINSSTGMESQASSYEGNIQWNSIDTLVNAESFAETSSYEYTNPFILTKDKTGYWYCHNVYGTTISATKIVLTLYYTKYN